MPQNPARQTGLKTGLIVLACVLLAGLGLVFTGPERGASTQMAETAPLLVDEPVFLQRLDTASPELADKTRRVLALSPSGERREVLLQSALHLFKLEAPRLRYASTTDFDTLVTHFRDGVQKLQDSGSTWCEAGQVETYVRLNETELIPVLIETFARDDDAYAWATQLANLYLDAIVSARARPVQHGQRTYRDKLILQDQGRAMGTRNWVMALSIAAFSQAEGQSYDKMREAIEAIDVCELSLAMADLSSQLPTDTRGRILAELLPETFYGNTPYALAVLTSFFFI
ncbi:MAG: hypothetical protein QNI84_11865 [Henriciella sp.]|nr:hypothetical protein [Henriciella sp.]